MPLRTELRRAARVGRAFRFALPVVLVAGSISYADPIAHLYPAVIDLGVIQEGNSYERFLTLTNAGDGLLILEDVKTSCGCTAAAVDGVVELGPGQAQDIKVTFDSRRMEGNIKKKVTVTTNDPANPRQDVLLQANVHMPVRWVPKYVRLDKVGPRDPFEQVVILESDPELNLEVKEAFVLGTQKQEGSKVIDERSELFDVVLGSNQKEGDRNVAEMTVKLRPGAKPQKLAERLMVVTNLEGDRDTLQTFIRGEIVGRVTAYPTFAVLKIVDPGEEAVRDVVISASHGTFKVVSAELTDCPVKVEVLPDPSGTKTTVRLTYVGEEPGVSGVRQLRIRTDDPDEALIEVPVRYNTRVPPDATRPAGAVPDNLPPSLSNVKVKDITPKPKSK